MHVFFWDLLFSFIFIFLGFNCWDSYMLMCVSLSPYVCVLNNILLYGYLTIYLFIFLFLDIWFISTFLPLSSGAQLQDIIPDVQLAVKFLVHGICAYSHCFPTNTVQEFLFFIVLQLCQELMLSNFKILVSLVYKTIFCCDILFFIYLITNKV